MWKVLWKIKAPSKLKIFLWRALHEALPTKEVVFKRSNYVLVECPSCPSCPESIMHVLVLYPLAKEVRFSSKFSLTVHRVRANSFVEWWCGRQGINSECNSFPEPPVHGGAIIFGLLRATQREIISGRPWRPYAKTVFIDSQIDAIFDPQGFLPWNGANNHQSCYYFEHNNKGLGADTAKGVAWPGVKVLTAVEASDFYPQKFYDLKDVALKDSWILASGVPYSPIQMA
ncbi:hypothetical protein L6164_025408 [Bauhinia variegata]|uniref:Uncharacterized protein n=1 Tax=Bauhinia variegata TaxID=167791 RepID=A0ACB9M0N1_BAUVA|nr:hypothetical protein L6164_025408 [Bauhinia variegata]